MQSTADISRLRHQCPHCGGHMQVRTSASDSPLMRELYMHCVNQFECGFRAVAQLELVRELAPARKPNPAARLDVSPWLTSQIRLGLESRPISKAPTETQKDEQ